MTPGNIFFTNLEDLKQGLNEDAGAVSLRPLEKSLPEQQWFTEDYEGQLSVDVYQTDKDIVVRSTIAGVEPKDLEIFLNNDLLTIRGRRSKSHEEKSAEYFYKECYWGGFSRTIIMPVDVDPHHVTAALKNGILTIHLPKIERTKTVSIKVNGE